MKGAIALEKTLETRGLLNVAICHESPSPADVLKLFDQIFEMGKLEATKEIIKAYPNLFGVPEAGPLMGNLLKNKAQGVFGKLGFNKSGKGSTPGIFEEDGRYTREGFLVAFGVQLATKRAEGGR